MKIFVIDGHPYEQGLSSQLANSYAKGAREAGHQVKVCKLRDLQFDPILRFGYRKKMEMEDDLLAAQQDIMWCQLLVIAMPIWWMNMPALLKGFIDRTFLPKFAYSFGNRKYLPKGLFKQKSLLFIYTQGAPSWITKLAFFDAHWLVMKFGIFKFVGLGPIKRAVVAKADKLTKKQQQKEVNKIYLLGKKMNK